MYFSAHRHKIECIFSDSKKFSIKTIQWVREIIGSFPMKKIQKKIYSKLLNFQKKLKFQLKFAKIRNF